MSNKQTRTHAHTHADAPTNTHTHTADLAIRVEVIGRLNDGVMDVELLIAPLLNKRKKQKLISKRGAGQSCFLLGAPSCCLRPCISILLQYYIKLGLKILGS